MFKLRYTAVATAQYEAIEAAAQAAMKNRKAGGKSPKQAGLLKQIVKTLDYLADNPRHPSLSTHKYNSMEPPPGVSEIFEAYAQNQTPGAYRIFWGYGPAEREITIVAITPHP